MLRHLLPVLLLLLVGCKFSFDSSPPPPVPPPAPNPLVGCWDSRVKASLQPLAQQIAWAGFVKSLPPKFTPAQVAKLKASFVVSVSTFLAYSYEPNAGSLVCGAGYGYSYKRPDGTVMRHNGGDLLKFDVYQGENGLVPTMNGAEQQAINIEYETAVAAAANGDDTGDAGATPP
ncbi:MAG TPA: hypothetical protein PLY97_03835 [Acidocella sp.]|nr:MAG: hypothetical protein B7Z81_12715 [Acidocella sp. 20-61-6]HQT46333.1 hypothetical protein [Acidocella sp.]